MKKRYSVKEAAKLLGVSTNTIYTYLKEGKLAAARIGMGRFKIPYTSLAPFSDFNRNYSEQDKTFNNAQPDEIDGSSVLQGMLVQKEQLSDRVIEDETILGVGMKDIVFYRLFKALMLSGVGIVYLLIDPIRISASSLFGRGMDEILIKILPFTLILSGFIALAGIVYRTHLQPIQGWIHVFTALVLGYYSLLAIFAQNFGLLVFSGSLLMVTVLHFFSGISKSNTFTFFSQFAKYFTLLALVGGIVVILFPEYTPFKILSDFIYANRGLSALIWFGVFIPILTILLSSGGKPIMLLFCFFFLGSVMTFIFATQLTLRAIWDASYLSFITGIFAMFLSVWQVIKVNLELKRLNIIIIAFIWISVSSLLGLYAIYSFQGKIKAQLMTSVNSNIEKTANDITNSFESQNAILVNFAADSSIKQAIVNNDSASLTAKAKEIYEKLDTSRFVSFYDAEGISHGIYPHLSIGLGTNFSEREYFQKTKLTYRNYISNVFENILGENTIVQTEPIFENNRFIGMIGVSMSLDALSDKYQREFGEEFSLQAVDENSVIVLASDKGKIGLKVNREELRRNLIADNEKIWAYQTVRNPNWEMYVETPVMLQIQNTSNLNVMIAIVILVNSIFTIGFAIVLSLKNGLQSLNAPRVFSIQKTVHTL